MSEIVPLVANLASVVDLCTRVYHVCHHIAIGFERDRDHVRRLINEAKTLKESLELAQEVIEIPKHKPPEHLAKLHRAIDECQVQLVSLDQKLSLPRRRAAIRAFTLTIKNREMDFAAARLAGCRNSISLAIQTIQSETTAKTRKIILASKLHVAEGASFDSHANEHNAGCHPTTQREILQTIYQWASDLHGKPILWLNGMAGTGKSTISLSVAHHFTSEGTLGASFFFKRGEADRGNAALFFTTIATQLIGHLPSLAPHVLNAVEQDPSISKKALGEQFEKLILHPVSEIDAASYRPGCIVVVIDGLDECDSDEDIRNIIKLLPKAKNLIAVRLKFLLTSRPELPTHIGFKDIDNDHDALVLHERPAKLIKNDISIFLRYQLEAVRDDYNKSVPFDRHLPLRWPEEEDTEKLIAMAAPLFLSAATICRFLRNWNLSDPSLQLSKFLGPRARGQNAKIEETYILILNRLLIGLDPVEKNDAINNFKTIIGSLVSLADPLSTRSLSCLLNVPKRQIDSQIDCLRSVLHVPRDPDAVVRILHDSFRQFLIDPEPVSGLGRSIFCINKNKTHIKLAKNCLHILSEISIGNADALNSLGCLKSETKDQNSNKLIPPEVRYALFYWVYHLKEGECTIRDGDDTHMFLQQHFLHWLDALSRINRISESINLINDLQELSPPPKASDVGAFLYDAKRFLLSYLPAIKISSDQIYKSALLFAPESSIIRRSFQAHIPPNITVLGADLHWGPCIKTLEGHTDIVYCVAISHDNLLIASASFDNTIMIWGSMNGVHRQTLRGHDGYVNSIAFSNSDVLLVSASNDATIVIWDIVTAQRIQNLRGHGKRVSFAAFSHCDSLIASASGDSLIKIWQVSTGLCLTTIAGNSPVNSIAWSLDDASVVSSSHSGTIYAWDIRTGSCLQVYKDHGSSVNCVVISHDGERIASASSDQSIKLWDIGSGACLRTLRGHKSWVTSASFTNDSKRIASTSLDHTVKIWCANTGVCVQTLKGHNDIVNSVAFSYDSTWLASASDDQMIKIWESNMRTCQRRHENHNDCVNSLIFSPDHNLLVSPSDDYSIKVWKSADGNCIRSLGGHTDSVNDIAFSSNGQYFASASSDKTIRIWRTTPISPFAVLHGHKDAILSVVFSHDNTLLASASDDAIFLWDCKSWTWRREIPVDNGRGFLSIAPSRNGTDIAAAMIDRSIRIWNTETGDCRQVLRHTSDINSVTFSDNDMYLVSSSRDGALITWDIHTSEQKRKTQVGTNLEYISVDQGGSHLQTEIGAICIDDSPTLLNPGANLSKHPVFQGYGLNIDQIWITKDGENLLWLPPQYRPWRSAIAGSIIALGFSDGRVIILHFSQPHKYVESEKCLPAAIEASGPGLQDDYIKMSSYNFRKGSTSSSSVLLNVTALLASMFIIGVFLITSGLIGHTRANMYVGAGVIGLSVSGCVYLCWYCLVRSFKGFI